MMMMLSLIDVGLPMIFVTIPVMVVALLPIIGLEAAVLRYSLYLDFKAAVRTAALANLASTFLGIPVTWFLLAAIQTLTGGDAAYGLNTPLRGFLAVTWQAPWLIPYDSDLHWMVPAAGLFLLIPFFFSSWYVEYFVVNKLLRGIDPAQTWRGIRNANLISYGLLAIYLVIVLVTAKRT